MQGSNNPFTADNENSVLNGSGREGKVRLKYVTNFEPLAPLYGEAHTHTHTHTYTHTHTHTLTHTHHEVHLHFIPKEKTIKNRFSFMVNDTYGDSGLGPWKSQWETHKTNRMIHIISSLYWKGSNIKHSSQTSKRGKSTRLK